MSIKLVMLSHHLTLNHLIFFFCLQSFPASGSFPKSRIFGSQGQSTKASASALVLPMNIQCWFPLGLTSLISLQSKGLSRVLIAPQLQSINSSALSFLYGSTITAIHNYWKNHSFDYMAFVGKGMSLLFNTLSRFVTAFLPRRVFFNFMAAVTIQSDSGAQENKICYCFHFPPSILYKVMEPDDMTLVFWILCFRPAFFLIRKAIICSL